MQPAIDEAKAPMPTQSTLKRDIVFCRPSIGVPAVAEE